MTRSTRSSTSWGGSAVPVGEPLDPVLYSWWVPALAGVLILAAIAWVLWVLRKPRTVNFAQMARDRRAPEVRLGYGQKLDALVGRFHRGEIDLRAFHLQIAELVREFGSERMGKDMSTMSRGEVESYYPGSNLGPLLARCEHPSFSRDAAGEAHHTEAMAREVIAQW